MNFKKRSQKEFFVNKMALRFETGHVGDNIILSLIDDYNLIIWQGSFERFKAETLVDLLSKFNPSQVVYVQEYSLSVEYEGNSVVLRIGDGSPYLKFKVLLSAGQVLDLISTIRINIHASEQEGRPKDILPPLDDTIGHWTPEKEKEHFGLDGPDDEDDPADRWKKGK